MKQIDRKGSYGKLKLSMLPGGSIFDNVIDQLAFARFLFLFAVALIRKTRRGNSHVYIYIWKTEVKYVAGWIDF